MSTVVAGIERAHEIHHLTKVLQSVGGVEVFMAIVKVLHVQEC
jgi:hypothetical protein